MATLELNPNRSLAVAAVFMLLLAIATTAARAQTFTVIHDFTGGGDGAAPMAGVTLDRAGNLYGTANYGGNVGGDCGASGCGLVYKLAHHNSAWVLTPLYAFNGGNDGMNPQVANVVFGPDGNIYSSTFYGGGTCNGSQQGCGTVFKLQPRANTCHSVLCPWNETILHRFNGDDGMGPVGAVLFDETGNLYGNTNAGSFRNGGNVYELQAGLWTEHIIANLYGYPGSAITRHDGNLYGSTFIGLDGPGTIFQLAQSGSSWISTNIYEFTGGDDGAYPQAGLIFDSAGSMYGATTSGGSGQGGTVFQFTPSNGGWSYNLLYSFDGPDNGQMVLGPVGTLTMDAGGNLYGTTRADGAFGFGAVFKLTHSDSGWTYTSLHDFTNGSDGAYPFSNVVFDASGKVYGTASAGGAFGAGAVFQISPQ